MAAGDGRRVAGNTGPSFPIPTLTTSRPLPKGGV